MAHEYSALSSSYSLFSSFFSLVISTAVSLHTFIFSSVVSSLMILDKLYVSSEQFKNSFHSVTVFFYF